MITITKSMVAVSALLAAGLVAAFDMPGPRAEESAPVQIAQRFPMSSEMFTPVPMSYFVLQKFLEQQQQADGRKGNKLPLSDCALQGWPYLSQNCVVTADGSPTRKVTRVITIERRVSENVSELVRMPVADLAQR